MERQLGADVGATERKLATAYADLEAADEAAQVQRDRIAELIEGQHLLRWQRERMTAVLPVPVLLTADDGTIHAVNAAAATLLQTRVVRLVGKSLVGMVAEEDREAVEAQLRRLAAGGASIERTVTLQSPDGAAVTVEMFVHRPADQVREISWMLLAGPLTGAALEPGGGVPAALAELALLPTLVSDEQEALTLAAEICQRGLGTVTSVSVIMGSPDAPSAVASTSAAAQVLDGAQLRAGEGPCLSAFADRGPVETHDVRADDRWPRLAAEVPPEIVGVMAAPLEVGDDLKGVLNVYVGEAPWPAALRVDVELLAVTVAGVLLELALKQELRAVLADLEQALTSRATIDQAKGIVMAHRGIGPDEAFEHLVELSSTQHVKLRDLAEEMVRRAGGG